MKITMIERNPMYRLEMIESHGYNLYYRVVSNYNGYIMFQHKEYKLAYNWMWTNESLWEDKE